MINVILKRRFKFQIKYVHSMEAVDLSVARRLCHAYGFFCKFSIFQHCTFTKKKTSFFCAIDLSPWKSKIYCTLVFVKEFQKCSKVFVFTWPHGSDACPTKEISKAFQYIFLLSTGLFVGIRQNDLCAMLESKI